jgi:hypothetical protein
MRLVTKVLMTWSLFRAPPMRSAQSFASWWCFPAARPKHVQIACVKSQITVVLNTIAKQPITISKQTINEKQLWFETRLELGYGRIRVACSASRPNILHLTKPYVCLRRWTNEIKHPPLVTTKTTVNKSKITLVRTKKLAEASWRVTQWSCWRQSFEYSAEGTPAVSPPST